jgi:5S rRNA maturation endonuclease (ribonuclease M5)
MIDHKGKTQYEYRDGNGRLLYIVAKFPGKNFRRLRYDQDGKEHWNWEGVQQLPYRWPDVKDSKAVLFVEGEKDVDSLHSIGVTATTIAGGSNAWGPLLKKQPDFAEKYFKQFDHIFIIPDNDESGEKFAQESGEHFKDFAKVWIVSLGLTEQGADATDYLNSIKGADQLKKESLLTLIEKNKQPWTPATSLLDLDKSWDVGHLNVDDFLDEDQRSQVENDLKGTHEKIIAQLRGVSWSGQTANAICPTHEDQKPSLSITLEQDKILMRCHSGCSLNKLCDFFGLKISELFLRRSTELRHHQQTRMAGPRPEELKAICSSLLERSEPEEFDDVFIPPILKDHIQEACQLTEASSAIMYGTALSSLGAHAGIKLCIKPPNYFVPLYGNIWCLSIAESGSFKTTALNAGSARLRDREERIIYEVKEVEGRLQALREAGVQDDNDELLETINDLQRFRALRKILPNKASWEACIDRMDDTGGGVWLLSEFGAWLAMLETSHNRGFRQHLTELYDVPSYFEDVTRTRGSKILRHPFVAISGVSTIEFLQGLLGKDDAGSGFLARFLLFKPPGSDTIPNALPGSATKIQELHSYRMLSEIYNQLDNITVPIEYTLTADAKKVFEEYHNSLFERFKATDDVTKFILDPFLKRWSPGVLKSAILFQYLLDSESQTISDAAVMAGISLSLYAEKCTRHLFKRELGESVHQNKQRRILEYIAKRRGAISRQKLLSSRILDGGHSEYDYILTSLEESGKIIMEKVQGKVAKNTKITLIEGK